MSKPKLNLTVSNGYYHLFIDDYHDPNICPECKKPGSWPAPKKD